MTPVRLEPAALRSQVKHSTTEPLRSLFLDLEKAFDLMLRSGVIIKLAEYGIKRTYLEINKGLPD